MPVVIPLLVRVQPDVVEVTLVAVTVQVEVVTVAAGIRPEMYETSSIPPSFESTSFSRLYFMQHHNCLLYTSDAADDP